MTKKFDGTISKISGSIFAIALVLLLAFSASVGSIPFASAHTPVWTIPTYAYLSVTPDPIGVGQDVFIVMTIDKAFPSAAVNNDIRPHDYKLIITKPDGTTETKTWKIIWDTTSAQFTLYTPTKEGTYKFRFEYPGQVYTWSGDYQNDTYLPSSKETTLTVQSEQIALPPTYPLPTSYWTRPIEGQNTAWASIASNWLSTPPMPGLDNFKQDGTAPKTAHVMWTQPLEFGGVVGGSNTGTNGAMYYNGMSYEGRFGSPIIIQGRLYYALPLSNNNRGGGYVCVDLRTGEEIWKQTYAVDPTFGQLYWFDSPNQHGVIPNGYLWAVSGTTWIAYDAMTGLWLFNLTGVPSGTNVYGPKGEILRYVLGGNGQWLACWNNTQSSDLDNAPSGPNSGRWRPIGKSVNTSISGYSWNKTLSQTLPAGSAISYVRVDDILLGSVGVAQGFNFGTPDPYTIFAISLKSQSLGQILWLKNYPAPEGNITRQLTGMGTFARVDIQNRVFIMLDKETSGYTGFSLDTGDQLWGPVELPRSYNYYSATMNNYDAGAHVAAYGNLYACGYGGLLYCIDTGTGQIKWTYGNGGEGNDTNSGLEAPWGYYPIFISNIADGKLYLFTSEHSPNSPLYKGALIRVIDANTGKELWKMSGWLSSGSFYSQAGAIADGYLTYLNTYDGQIYCVGKGPSQTTVTASPGIGNIVTIQGSVIDRSSGAEKLVQTGEFNVVPVISDSDMGRWMEYLHMQKSMPTNATGVPLTIFVTDQSGNTVYTTQTTSDISGQYAISWESTKQGLFTVTAVFEGSDGYYGSNAETHISIAEAQATAQPTSTPPSTISPTETPTATPTSTQTTAPQPGNNYTTVFYVAIAAIIIIIAIVTAAVLVRRRK